MIPLDFMNIMIFFSYSKVREKFLMFSHNFIEEDLSELEESDIETDHEVSDDDEQEEEEEPESELPVDSDREGSEVYDDYEDNDDFCDYND